MHKLNEIGHCPQCRGQWMRLTEKTVCPDCGVLLVAELPKLPEDNGEPCCDMWPIHMATLTDAMKMAAMNGNPSKIEPPNFCPWCATPTIIEKEGRKTTFRCGPRFTPPECPEGEVYVTVTPQTSQRAGSCNACSRYTTGHGESIHPVTQIDLRRCSFRVCDSCLHDLVFKLQLRLTDVLRKS